MSEDPTYVKCVAVGDDGAGKTCMLITYTYGSFPEYIPTQYDPVSLIVTVDNKQVQLQLWDSAGAEKSDKLRRLATPQPDVFVVCFNIILPSSFENISRKWIPEIRYHWPDASIILVGTVSDLRDNVNALEKLAADGLSPITYEQGQKLAIEMNANMYLECSSLTQQGLKEVFEEAARAVIKPVPAPKQKNKVCVVL